MAACRQRVSSLQDAGLAAQLRQLTSTPLRDASQRRLFIVAPLDVLVTRDAASGRNTFHVTEINGSGATATIILL